MMELFEKGMDFTSILLKAKVNMHQINFSDNVTLSGNYALNNNNEGSYMGQGLGPAVQIFQRFDEY